MIIIEQTGKNFCVFFIRTWWCDDDQEVTGSTHGHAVVVKVVDRCVCWSCLQHACASVIKQSDLVLVKASDAVQLGKYLWAGQQVMAACGGLPV